MVTKEVRGTEKLKWCSIGVEALFRGRI